MRKTQTKYSRCAGTVFAAGMALSRPETGLENQSQWSVAMPGADRDALAPCGAAAAEHGGAGVGLHARPEAVRLRSVAAVGLECTLGHGYPLLFLKENLQFSSIF